MSPLRGSRDDRALGVARSRRNGFLSEMRTLGETPPHGERTRFVEASDGTRIAWHVHPTDDVSTSPRRRRTLVLTNGLSSTENFWKYLIPTLEDRYDLLVWNYRGHGESESAKNGDYRIVTHAADLERVVEAFRRERNLSEAPIHVAFSMGVTVLLELYRTRPDLVGAMVLIGGGADHPYASIPLFQIPGARRAVQYALSALSPVVPRIGPILKRVVRFEGLFPLAQLFGTIGRHAPRDEIEHFFRAVGDMDLHAYWGSVCSLMQQRASNMLSTVRVPVLVIAPERDVLALRADLRALHERIRGSEWTLVPRTGHAILLEAGARVGQRIRQFVDRLERLS